MPRASAAQTVLPLGDQSEPEDICGWEQILSAAFADPNRTSGFLTQAKEAVRAQPGDGLILLLATTAGLLDHNPERAQLFLKRFSKRYVTISAYHLLRALALAEQSKLGLARSVLQAHQLTNRFDALQHFPGGWTRRAWLFRQYDRIFECDIGGHRKRRTSGTKRSRAQKTKPGEPHRSRLVRAGEAPAALPTPPAPAGLPLIDVDIPFTAELDLAPLLSTPHKPPESNGGWY